MVNNKRTHMTRIERQIVALESRLAAGSGRGEQRFMIQETEGDVTELEARMVEVLQLYSQQLRVRAGQPHREEESKQVQFCKKWHGWVRMARHRNTENKMRRHICLHGGDKAVA